MTSALPTAVVPQVRLASGLSHPQLTFGPGPIVERVPFEQAVTLLEAALRVGIRAFDIGNYTGMPGTDRRSDADVLFRSALAAAGIAREDYVHVQKIWTWTYPEESLDAQLTRHFFRVGVDHADVGVIGSLYDRGFGVDQLVAEVGELVAAGRLGAWAINNWPAHKASLAIEEATRQGVRPPEFVQLAYSVARRAVPEGAPYREVFARTGLSPQASIVFESGLLLENDTHRWPGAGSDPRILDRIRAARPLLVTIARDLGATPAQLALAFVLTHPDAVPLATVGFSSPAQLADLLGAYALLERVGASAIRAAVAGLTVDAGLTDPTRGVHVDPGTLPVGRLA